MSKHALYIFENLYNNLPPLVPEQVKNEIGVDLNLWKSKNDFDLGQLEAVIIKHSKNTWPERSAFRELVQRYKTKFGEIFLRNKISKDVDKKYEEFLAHGGNFDQLYYGGPTGFFSSEEMVILSQIMVEVMQDITEHARQAVFSVDRDWYERRITEFEVRLKEIEEKIMELRKSVDGFDDHPDLVEEMKSHILALEQGLSILGPQTHQTQFDNANDYLDERHEEKELFRTLGF